MCSRTGASTAGGRKTVDTSSTAAVCRRARRHPSGPAGAHDADPRRSHRHRTHSRLHHGTDDARLQPGRGAAAGRTSACRSEPTRPDALVSPSNPQPHQPDPVAELVCDPPCRDRPRFGTPVRTCRTATADSGMLLEHISRTTVPVPTARPSGSRSPIEGSESDKSIEQRGVDRSRRGRCPSARPNPAAPTTRPGSSTSTARYHSRNGSRSRACNSKLRRNLARSPTPSATATSTDQRPTPARDRRTPADRSRTPGAPRATRDPTGRSGPLRPAPDTSCTAASAGRCHTPRHHHPRRSTWPPPSDSRAPRPSRPLGLPDPHRRARALSGRTPGPPGPSPNRAHHVDFPAALGPSTTTIMAGQPPAHSHSASHTTVRRTARGLGPTSPGDHPGTTTLPRIRWSHE